MSVPAFTGNRVRAAGGSAAGTLLGAAGALLGAAGLGASVASAPALGALLAALAGVVLAVPFVDALSVLMFWTLPYMAVNLPTGGFTLKLCDMTAYLFAGAWAVRAVLRREPVALPPATVQVLLFLAALCVSAACAPAVPLPYLGNVSSSNRNAPDLRSLSLIVWLGVAWLVVVALYNLVGSRPALFHRCLRAHILGAGTACVLSLVLYGLGLTGMRFYEPNGHSLVFDTGKFLRLAGVAYEPTFLGFYLMTSIPLTLTVLQLKPDWMPRRAGMLSLGAQSLAMLLTFSAGGWGSLSVAMLCLAAFLGKRFPLRALTRLGLAAAVLAVVAAGVFAAQPKLMQTVMAETVGKIVQGGDQTRKQEWQVGYGIISDYPVTGVGPGLARFYFSRYHEHLRSQPLNKDLEINSLYVNTLAEDGFLGMLALVGVGTAGLAGLALPLLKYSPTRVPFLAALTASLVGCAAQFAAVNSLFLVYFTALVGLALAGARVARSEHEAPLAPHMEAA